MSSYELRLFGSVSSVFAFPLRRLRIWLSQLRILVNMLNKTDKGELALVSAFFKCLSLLFCMSL